MFVFILVLVSMGSSMLWAARGDYADGNGRDGKFLVLLGASSLLVSGVLALVPFL